MRVLDTFAGAGGFSLGFEMAGCSVVGAIERDDWACETFQYNHPDATVLAGPIEGFSDQVLLDRFRGREPDILLGGPPCQGFSVCTRNAGDPTDPRNSLFREFLRVASIFMPTAIIMENVPNLLKAKTASKQRVIDIIAKELEGLGYHVYFDVLDAPNYGVPQIRRRLIVIATRTPLRKPMPEPTHYVASNAGGLFEQATDLKPCPTLWDAISDLPQIDAREGEEIMSYEGPPHNEYQAILRRGSAQIFNHTAMKHSSRLVARFAAMSCGDTIKDLPNEFRPLMRNGEGMTSEKLYDQNNRRMHPHRQCHTIAASFYANFVHPFRNRNFTPREGARIQSFPDAFLFKGKPTVVSRRLLEREERHSENHLCQYNQIGNAVPPLLACSIASNVLSQLQAISRSGVAA